jgi:hypothetical protein
LYRLLEEAVVWSSPEDGLMVTVVLILHFESEIRALSAVVTALDSSTAASE